MNEKPSDREVRDVLVSDYQRHARSRGVDPSTRDLEALAVHDLILTDSVEANKKPRIITSSKPERTGPTPAELLARDMGGTFTKRACPKDAPRIKQPLEAVVGDKYTALIKRMREMCALSRDPAKSRSLADKPYLFPSLAKGVLQAHADYTFGRRQFRGLNHRDKQKAFWRAIEDLADKSNSVIGLGPWWVK